MPVNLHPQRDRANLGGARDRRGQGAVGWTKGAAFERLLDELRRDGAVLELLGGECPPVERDGRRDALELHVLERVHHAAPSELSILCPDDELGEQRVIPADDRAACRLPGAAARYAALPSVP